MWTPTTTNVLRKGLIRDLWCMDQQASFTESFSQLRNARGKTSLHMCSLCVWTKCNQTICTEHLGMLLCSSNAAAANAAAATTYRALRSCVSFHKSSNKKNSHILLILRTVQYCIILLCLMHNAPPHCSQINVAANAQSPGWSGGNWEPIVHHPACCTEKLSSELCCQSRAHAQRGVSEMSSDDDDAYSSGCSASKVIKSSMRKMVIAASVANCTHRQQVNMSETSIRNLNLEAMEWSHSSSFPALRMDKWIVHLKSACFFSPWCSNLSYHTKYVETGLILLLDASRGGYSCLQLSDVCLDTCGTYEQVTNDQCVPCGFPNFRTDSINTCAGWKRTDKLETVKCVLLCVEYTCLVPTIRICYANMIPVTHQG